MKLRKVEIGASVALVVWVVFRFTAVWGTLRKYGVNPWIFLVLDVATIWPYVRGISHLLTAIKRNDSFFKSVIWASVVIVSFSLPYAYLYVAGGREFPMIVDIVIIGVVILLAVGAVVKIVRQYRK